MERILPVKFTRWNLYGYFGGRGSGRFSCCFWLNFQKKNCFLGNDFRVSAWVKSENRTSATPTPARRATRRAPRRRRPRRVRTPRRTSAFAMYGRRVRRTPPRPVPVRSSLAPVPPHPRARRHTCYIRARSSRRRASFYFITRINING